MCAGCIERRDVLRLTKHKEIFSDEPYSVRRKLSTSPIFHCAKGPLYNLHQASKLLVLYLEADIYSVNDTELPSRS